MQSKVVCAFLFCQSEIEYRNSQIESLDHPICSREHLRGNCQADLLGGFEIDYHLEFRRLFDGNVGWLGTFQDLIDISTRRV